MLNNLTGWHFLIILGVLLLIAAVVAAVVVAAVVSTRRMRSAATPPAPTDPVAQIRRLGELRDDGLISEDEFVAKRDELLGRI